MTEYARCFFGDAGKSEMQIFELDEAAKASVEEGDVPEKVIETAKWFKENGETATFKTAAEGAGLSVQQRGGKTRAVGEANIGRFSTGGNPVRLG